MDPEVHLYSEHILALIKLNDYLIPKDLLLKIGERYFDVCSPIHKVAFKVFFNTVESIQSELPQYQFDIERKQITEKSQLKSICGTQPKYPIRENGLLCDEYTDESCDLEVFDNQDYHDNYETLRDAFPNVTIIRDEKFGKLEREVLGGKGFNMEYLNCSMVPFQMPDKFEYTGAIMINNLFEGLLHTFVRNWKKWSQLIKGLKETIDNLWHIQPFLKKIQKAKNLESTGKALNELSDKLSKLDPLTFIDMKLALLQAQLQLHKYLEQTINSKVPSPTHKKGNFMEHFELPDKRVLNICTSKQPYQEVLDFGCQGIEERPIRVIRTVVFNDTPIDQIQEAISPLKNLEIKKDDDHQNEHEQEHENKLDQLIDLEAQTGIGGDCYEIDDLMPSHALEDKELHKTNLVNQKVEDKKLGNSDPNVEVFSDRELNKLIDDVKKSRDSVDKFKSKKLLLHLKMPPKDSKDGFEYTTAIMTNDPMQGLEHSFIRHWNQWEMHIPALKRTLKKLRPIQDALDEVNDAENHGITKVAIDKLKGKLGKLSAETFEYVQLALFEAQMQIHEFILANLTSENYLNERVNYYKQIHAYFKIPNKDQLLVVGVSQQLFPALDEFSKDDRLVRFVTTAYFMDRDQYYELLIKHKSSIKQFAKPDLTAGERQNILDKHKRQVHQSTTLIEHYKNKDPEKKTINLISQSQYSRLQTGIGDGHNPVEIENRFFRQFYNKKWLFVTMPKNLRYTCVIMLNGIEEGLLHTMVRHSNQWSNYIDNFQAHVSKERLNANIAKIFNTIIGLNEGSRTYETDKKTAYSNYYNAVATIFDVNQLRDIRQNLLIAQMKIYNFILENTNENTNVKIFEEDVTKKGRVRVLFKVQQGTNAVESKMALCVSNELFPIIDEYDERPVRTIPTVYFIGTFFYDESYDDEDSHRPNIMTLKQIDEMYSNNNKHISAQSDFKMEDDEFPGLG